MHASAQQEGEIFKSPRCPGDAVLRDLARYRSISNTFQTSPVSSVTPRSSLMQKSANSVKHNDFTSRSVINFSVILFPKFSNGNFRAKGAFTVFWYWISNNLFDDGVKESVSWWMEAWYFRGKRVTRFGFILKGSSMVSLLLLMIID